MSEEQFLPDQLLAAPAFQKDLKALLLAKPAVMEAIARIADSPQGFSPHEKASGLAKETNIDCSVNCLVDFSLLESFSWIQRRTSYQHSAR